MVVHVLRRRSVMTWTELTSFEHCVEGRERHSCEIFNRKTNPNPSTMSLSVLCVVEMFNGSTPSPRTARCSPTRPGPTWLVGAIVISMALHCSSSTSRGWRRRFRWRPQLLEWRAVINFSFPVIIVDEILVNHARSTRVGVASRRRGDLLPRTSPPRASQPRGARRRTRGRRPTRFFISFSTVFRRHERVSRHLRHSPRPRPRHTFLPIFAP